MTSTPVNWHEDVALDPAKEYRALVRSLRWTEGFGVVFVQCSLAKGTELVERVRQDLAGKTVEVLTLKAEDTNLLDCVAALPNVNQINVLFVQGVEQSIYAYERSQAWETPSDAYNYSEAAVPRLLSHLNLNRELFYQHFPFVFVFLVPTFVLKYVSRRAPDFFDWRSGVLEFPADAETAQREYERLYHSGDYNEYLTWIPKERTKKILEIQTWLDEPETTQERKANLLFEQALLFNASEKNEEAIASYDKALEIKPDKHEAYYNRGNSLANLGRYEEAIASYDMALEIKPDDHEAYYNRGNSLDNLGRYEEAIASYDMALEIKPDKHEAYYNRGISLRKLGRYEEAIASYDMALEIKPDDPGALYNKACCYGLQNQAERASDFLKQAIDLYVECRDMAKTDTHFDLIRESDRFRAVVEGD
jgi:tetratricopeptide (TPR) repeat protein